MRQEHLFRVTAGSPEKAFERVKTYYFDEYSFFAKFAFSKDGDYYVAKWNPGWTPDDCAHGNCANDSCGYEFIRTEPISGDLESADDIAAYFTATYSITPDDVISNLENIVNDMKRYKDSGEFGWLNLFRTANLIEHYSAIFHDISTQGIKSGEFDIWKHTSKEEDFGEYGLTDVDKFEEPDSKFDIFSDPSRTSKVFILSLSVSV